MGIVSDSMGMGKVPIADEGRYGVCEELERLDVL